jgi:flagellar FliL protein
MTDQAAASPADLEDGEEGETPESAGIEKKPDRKKLLLLIGLPIILLIAAAAGIYFSGLADPFLKSNETVKTDEPPPPKPAVFLDLPEILVNLNSAGTRRTNFLKISISLEVESSTDVVKLQSLMPRIVDSFQVYLRELRVEDLKGSAGMYRLREDLLRRINEATRPVKVNDVLFKEMLIQ